MRNLTLSIVGFLAIKLLCSFGAATVSGPEGTNGNYIVSQDQQTETLRIVTCNQGNPVDEEILLRNPTTMYTHKATLAELKTALKIPVGYIGVTSGVAPAAVGVYTVTYPTPYATVPVVNAELIGGSITNFAKVNTSTVNGFTVITYNTNNVVGLLPTYTPVSGLTVNVSVIPN